MAFHKSGQPAYQLEIPEYQKSRAHSFPIQNHVLVAALSIVVVVLKCHDSPKIGDRTSDNNQLGYPNIEHRASIDF